LALDGLPHNLQPMRAIYDAFKKRDFRETYWQIVYPGQIGGLIKSPGNQILEFHVRFFENGTIYAEFEAGRSAILHFLIRRCYLNNYLGIKIASDLSVSDLQYYYDAVTLHKASSAKDWPEWSSRSKLVNESAKRNIRLLSAISDWRMLFLAMLVSMAAIYARDIVALPVLALIMILFYLVAPKRY
jgi:hypothetical protein